ncbi:unnamed protein product [Zymoseptoria tritici ST99CH_3D1]|uniref:Uncharacterized protein n=1 Tax=Zymoseptoria tritici (strain ST99CH_3D7) TaxID=1276538 RepID=A0A1X7S0H2_ZYMT9|nr:unnamed protein product [Zymoseptoria tritici ST99CH_3D7]SMR59626.1 unnamed protein product [Zymoseptoria tritici ST99CH_3D1]
MEEEEAKEQLWTARQAQVAEDRAAERARLTRLGNLAIDHMNKHRTLLNEADKEDDIAKKRYASCIMRKDAEQLVIIGKILCDCNGAGKHFWDTGEEHRRLLRDAFNIDVDQEMINLMVDGWTSHWKTRDLITGRGWDLSEKMQDMPVTPEIVSMPHSDLTNAKWWDVLMQVRGYDEKANCAFCGEAPAIGAVLQICGAQGDCQAKSEKRGEGMDGGNT